MTLHFDPADRAYFRAIATWAVQPLERFDAADVSPIGVIDAVADRIVQLPPDARDTLARGLSSPDNETGELAEHLRSMVSSLGLGLDARRKLGAIVGESPDADTLRTNAVGLLRALLPVDATPQPGPTEQRTDSRSTPANGCEHCSTSGCTGCVRTDSTGDDELLDEMGTGEKLVRARHAGRREADRALRRVIAEESGTEIDDDEDDDTSGTSDDELDDATETRATRRRTRNDSTDHLGGHMSRRDDLQIITSPRSPAEQRAARTRFDHSVDDAIRESHRSDAHDRELERLLGSDEVIPFVAGATEQAARDAMYRRVHAVGRETRSDARDAGTSPATFHAAQRRRFHLPDDGGTDGGPAAA